MKPPQVNSYLVVPWEVRKCFLNEQWLQAMATGMLKGLHEGM